LLYNLEIATVLLGVAAIAMAISYKVIKLSGYKVANGISLNLKSYILALIAFAISMLPMLIYDVGHGFPQTLKLLAWMGYRVMVMFGYPVLHPSIQPSFAQMVVYSFEQLGLLVFPYSGWVALGVFVVSLVVLLRSLDSRLHGNDKRLEMTILLVLNVVLIGGFLAGRTASGAYLPMMFPPILLLMAVWLNGLMVKKIRPSTLLRLFEVLGVIGVMCFNSYYSFVKNSSGDDFVKRLDVAKYIVKEAGGKEYNLIGRGAASEFESFTMNYEYLAWWLGNGPTDAKQPLRFIISEEKGIQVKKELRVENNL
jgi:hypothetical protein